MYYLYGIKTGKAKQDSEQQLRSYVRWATLQQNADGSSKFEQGSPLVGYSRWEFAAVPQPDDDAATVVHNPTPSML